MLFGTRSHPGAGRVRACQVWCDDGVVAVPISCDWDVLDAGGVVQVANLGWVGESLARRWTMIVRRWLVLACVVTAAIVVWAAPVMAVPITDPSPGSRQGSNTEVTFTSLGAGQGVAGFIADASNPFDPLSGYPTSNPGAGFTPLNEGFAGIIVGTPSGGGAPLSLYCIDIRTVTRPGFGYELGTWSEASVPRVGYVARLLNSYYPNVPTAPAGLANDNQRAAAVQAAVWYFSDRYVLNTSDPLHDTVAAIATAVIAAGPLDQPPPPSLTITPTTQSGPAGTAVGPFQVVSAASTTVTATGAVMFADAAATVPIANGATVASGTNIWMTSTGPSSAVLSAKAQATVPTGNVYLYDGNTPGVTSAQKLILAQTATLTTTVTAQAYYQAPGSLVVTKTIAGDAAGQQGQIVIVVSCNGVVLTPPFVIPAGTSAGSVSQTYGPIPAGSVCNIVETQDGHIATVTARHDGNGTIVTIPAGGTATALLTNTYETGSLIVNKIITGAAAGQQTDVTVGVICGQTTLADFVIPAGAPAGTRSAVYDGIPAGTTCTATETTNGATSEVTVVTEGSPQSVVIAPNGSGTINITNTYTPVTGSLIVIKLLSGSGAGQQSNVGILVACGVPHLFAVLIPAGTPAGSFPQSFDAIPAGTTCTVAEVIDGANTIVSVDVGTNPQTVVIPPNDAATVEVANLVEINELPTTTTIATTTSSATTSPAATTTTLSGTLPRTGTSRSLIATLPTALLIVTAGAALVLIARRRTTR